jgi:hypothetical protein
LHRYISDAAEMADNTDYVADRLSGSSSSSMTGEGGFASAELPQFTEKIASMNVERLATTEGNFQKIADVAERASQADSKPTMAQQASDASSSSSPTLSIGSILPTTANIARMAAGSDGGSSIGGEGGVAAGAVAVADGRGLSLVLTLVHVVLCPVSAVLLSFNTTEVTT